MSSQNLPSMQDNARELRTSGMDANQMYEEVRLRGDVRRLHAGAVAVASLDSHPPGQQVRR